MRLLTRADFDGLVCAVILLDFGIIDSWKFVHPKDMQDGKVEVKDNDVLANVPYVPGCNMWFDHHSSEEERLDAHVKYNGVSRRADSAARVIFECFDGNKRLTHMLPLIEAVDKVDSAKLTIAEIQNPSGWVFLGFIMDPRTGLGRFRDFRIANFELMDKLIQDCRTKTAEQIFEDPDVQERVKVYREQNAMFKEMVLKHTRTEGNVIVSDLRGVDPIYAGNRFLVYSLYPEQNVSIWVVDGREKQNCPIAVGHSIVNRTSRTDVGSLMLKYGGGGHKAVGTCQVPYADADQVLSELTEQMRKDG